MSCATDGSVRQYNLPYGKPSHTTLTSNTMDNLNEPTTTHSRNLSFTPFFTSNDIGTDTGPCVLTTSHATITLLRTHLRSPAVYSGRIPLDSALTLPWYTIPTFNPGSLTGTPDHFPWNYSTNTTDSLTRLILHMSTTLDLPGNSLHSPGDSPEHTSQDVLLDYSTTLWKPTTRSPWFHRHGTAIRPTLRMDRRP